MRIVVFSDSHGRSEKLIEAISEKAPDMIIHLGDGSREVLKIKEQFPKIPLKAVQGNCDIGSPLPETEVFSVKGLKFFITHGHIYSVKRTIEILVDEALANNADIAMYGHTHVADNRTIRGLRVMNPGSCGPTITPTCAVIDIPDSGEPSCLVVGI